MSNLGLDQGSYNQAGFGNLGRASYNKADWQEFQTYSYGTGVNVKSAPQELNDTDLSQALNVYLRTDGGIEQRKGYAARSALFSGGFMGGARLAQTIVNNTPQNPSIKFLLGQRGNDLVDIDRGVVIQTNAFFSAQKWQTETIWDPDHQVTAYAPATAISSTVTTTGSFAAGTYLVTYAFGLTNGGNTAASSESTVNVTASGSSLNITLPTIPYGVNAVHVYTTAVGGSSGSELSTGTNYTVTPGTKPTLLVNAPGSGVAQPTVATNNVMGSDVLIIVTGGGGPYIFDGYSVYTPPAYTAADLAGTQWVEVINNVVWFGGIPSQTNLVVGTAIGYPEGNTNAAVNLQPTGLPSYAQFATSGPVTGLSVIGAGPQAGLVIGMNKGLSVLFGTAPGNYFQQDVPSEDGVASGYAMSSYSGIVYFIGKQAIYQYDGSSNPTQISQNIEPWILNDPLHQDYSLKGDRTQCFSAVYNNKLHVFYDVTGSGLLNAAVVYDFMTGGWTPLQMANPFSAFVLLDAPGDPSPAQSVVFDSQIGYCYNWDAYATNQPAGLTHSVSDNGAPITASFTTKFFKVGVPGTPKRIMRVYPELFFEAFTGTIGVTTNYGTGLTTQLIINPQPGNSQWDAFLWDVGQWSAAQSQEFYGAPESRFDMNLTGEAFGFNLSTSSVNPPWVLQGFTGVYKQESRV